MIRYIAENDEDFLTIQEPGPSAYLVLLANGRVSQSYPLRGETQLGRDKANGVVVADQKVSRHHANLTPVDDTFILSDQGSANGTYLNGVLISQPTRLKNSDRLNIGDIQFVFTTDAPESEAFNEAIQEALEPVPAPIPVKAKPPFAIQSLNDQPLWVLVGCMGLTIVGLMLILAVLLGLFIGSGQLTGSILLYFSH